MIFKILNIFSADLENTLAPLGESASRKAKYLEVAKRLSSFFLQKTMKKAQIILISSTALFQVTTPIQHPKKGFVNLNFVIKNLPIGGAIALTLR